MPLSCASHRMNRAASIESIEKPTHQGCVSTWNNHAVKGKLFQLLYSLTVYSSPIRGYCLLLLQGY